MSDLIIKPSGTGASLKIQNPSGTNKIVMNSSGTITTGTLGSGVTFPSGFPIQVVNKNFPDNYSHSGTTGTFVAVSGFTQTFTLTSSTNKVLVLLSTTIANSNNQKHTAVRVVRDGNPLMDAVGSRGLALGGHQTTYSNADNSVRNGTGTYYDSPGTTSEVTYAVQGFSMDATFYMNRAATDSSSDADYMIGTSNLTLIEIQV